MGSGQSVTSRVLRDGHWTLVTVGTFSAGGGKIRKNGALAALAMAWQPAEAHWFENAYIACRDRIFIQGICQAMSRIGKDNAGGPLAPESATQGLIGGRP